MDTELKAKWVEALRSGEYAQARGTLKDDDGAYCCLGVLCVVAGLTINRQASGIEGSEGYWPIWRMVPEFYARELATMNDGSDKKAPQPFPAIADYIEAQIPASLPSAHDSHR